MGHLGANHQVRTRLLADQFLGPNLTHALDVADDLHRHVSLHVVLYRSGDAHHTELRVHFEASALESAVDGQLALGSAHDRSVVRWLDHLDEVRHARISEGLREAAGGLCFRLAIGAAANENDAPDLVKLKAIERDAALHELGGEIVWLRGGRAANNRRTRYGKKNQKRCGEDRGSPSHSYLGLRPNSEQRPCQIAAAHKFNDGRDFLHISNLLMVKVNAPYERHRQSDDGEDAQDCAHSSRHAGEGSNACAVNMRPL